MSNRLPRISVGPQPVKYVPIPSKKFICTLCGLRVIENTPIIPRGSDPARLKNDPRFFESKITCPNFCHLKVGFGFKNIHEGR